MEIRKKKISSAALIVAFVIMLAVAFIFCGASVSAHAASGGSNIDYNSEDFAMLSMDVNGATAAGEEQQVSNIETNNTASPLYRKRTIYVSALANAAFNSDSYNSYRLLQNGNNPKLYNYTDNYFSVKPVLPQGTGVSYYAALEITALKSTASFDKKPRFAFVIESGNNAVTVYVEMTISAIVSSSNISTMGLYVGEQLDSTLTGEIASDSKEYISFPIELTNDTSSVIDLNKYLTGRKLYTSNPNNSAHTVEADDETAKGVLKSSLSQSVSEYYAFNDLSEYTISVTNQPTLGEIIKNVDFIPTGNGVNHKFIVTLDFSTSDIGNMDLTSTGGKFWGQDGAYFELPVTLERNNTTLKINLPVVFVPSDAPKTLGEFVMDTALNAGSSLSFPQDDAGVAGYKTVRIYPESLCDFPAYDNESMWFLETQAPESNYYVRVASGVDENNKVYYDVTALENGRTDLTFKVHYNLYRNGGYASDDIDVRVSFTVYGGYSVTLNIAGTKTQKFTTNSSIFSNLKSDTYQIVSAVLYKFNSDDTNNYATVVCSNGVLSITPQRSVSDTETVGVIITMVNREGRKIELLCPMQIDLKAGDFFSGWQTYKIILFWVGIGLGAALLILLIVWLFIRSIHKHKIDELETTAPTSAYIIKLNSTIAAAQAQQRLASQPFAPAQSQMLQLGTGSITSPAPDPNTLALGVTPQTSTPAFSTGAPIPPTTSMAYGVTDSLPPLDEIYIPISDEELLIRIYEEKFEPRGMLKRTFDKSKDLQQRELEREKERIREDVRNGMSIEEACKSLKQREAEAAGLTATGSTLDSRPKEPQVDPLIALLGFDPADPIVPEVTKSEITPDMSDEEKRLIEAEYNNARLHAELSIIESRIESIVSANVKTESDIADANAAIESLNSGLKEAEQKLDDKNTDLAVERRKSAKEVLNKEIAELESKIRADKETLSGKKLDVDNGNEMLNRLHEINDDYAGKKESTEALVATSDQELENAREEARKAAELAAKAKHQAELNAKLEILNPMMLTVNTLDGEIAELTESISNSTMEKDSRKTRVSALQSELLTTTDSAKIAEISNTVKDLNKEISELDRAATANTTLKSNKGIEMSSVRRKANEFIEKEGIEVEEVIAAEDVIIGQIAFDKLLKQAEEDVARAQAEVDHWHGVCDSLSNNLDSLVMEAAVGVAEQLKAAENELAEAQSKLDVVNASIEAAVSDDEKLNLTMEQVTLQEEVKRLTEALEEARAEGIKSNMEFRAQSDSEMENARAELSKATEDFQRATDRFNEVSTSVNPLDLIVSGSGVISQDRKKIEAENLKKILAEQQNAIEQAKLAAQIAQQEAEKAVADAQRASEESKAEAERLAQEALEKADAAREEAEQKAKEEAERIRLEAQEEIERVRREAEEARRLAEEEAESARRISEEERERVRLEAEEAKRKAAEEAEAARKAAEEEAERIRIENEEAARKAAEEAEKAKKEAEEEAARKAEEEAKRKARIDEKVEKRKAEIATLRGELKNVADEEQGAALKEKFYAIKLALDEDEKTSNELSDLLDKAMDDASHAAELSHYKKLANQKPRRVVKKVTERVNRVPKKKPGAGARPAARPSGARPAARPGARPAARPSGARPAARPGARPAARPSGARPAARPGTRPSGNRPTTRK